MKSDSPAPHKKGANRKEAARKTPKLDPNFRQSRDIREDRGERQSKLANPERTLPAQQLASKKKAQPALPGRNSKTAATAFPQAQPAGPAPASAPMARLALRVVEAQAVFVAGSFNDWAADATPLQWDGAESWVAELALQPGEYEYRFVVDGQWQEDPAASRRVFNPFGGMNSILEVGAQSAEDDGSKNGG
jgi:hypothetical protein